jgi:hypothetical protein
MQIGYGRVSTRGQHPELLVTVYTSALLATYLASRRLTAVPAVKPV